MTSWKYLHCPFFYQKDTSNEMKKIILKLNFAICGESEKSPGEWKSYPFQFSDLDNSMDCKNHGTAKSLTRLSAYKIPFLSEKKNLFFLSFQSLALIADTQRMGRSGERGRLNVFRWSKKKWGCLTWMGSAWHGFSGKWGDRMRRWECRHWWWLHSTVKALIFPNCIN